MSDAITVEQLEIDVQSSASSATSGIDALASSLEKLKTAVKGGAGLSTVSKQLTTLNSALGKVTAANTETLNKLSKSLVSLSAMKDVKLSTTISKRIVEIGEALETFSNGNFEKSVEQIERLTKALTPLASVLKNVSGKKVNIIGNVQQLSSDNQKVASSNNKLADSYTNLAAKVGIAYTAVKSIAKMIASWINESNTYIENLNLFTVSMGEYANEAQKYAEQVGAVMGIDPGEWMRNQGIFMTLATGFGVVNDRAYIMSKNLTQLGYDLSSFFNISFEDAMQKLQSGISGELEPLRRLGYDLSDARLKQEALALGIEKSTSAMTQAEKAELRYHAIMTQVTKAQGDLSRTINTPMNQFRILKEQVTQCARALGNIFVPVINVVLPYIIALAKAVRIVIDTIASFFNFELPTIDYSSLDSAVGGTEEIQDNLGGAADEAKKVKNALLGIDELNIISPEDTSSGSGSGSGVGTGGGFGFELPNYNFLGDLENQVDELTQKLQSMLPLIGGVAAAFATWGLANWLAKLLGLSDVIKALTFGDYLSIFAGLLLTVGGAILYISGAVDALENGVDAKNLIKMLGGIASAATGVYLILKPFSTTLAPIAAGITAAVGGLGLLAISLSDIEKNGANLPNIIGSIAGLTTVVAGLSVAFKNSKLAIAPVIAPLAAFAGSLAIVKSTIVDIILNGASFTNVFGLIAGGIAAVTAAVYLWNAACAINPILAIAMLAIGIVAAIKGIADAVSAAGEEAYKASEDYQVMENILNRCAEASDRCTSALDTMNAGIETLDTTSYDFATASHLLEEIFAINDNVNASNYDLQLMAVKVDILNNLGIEGLSLSIDETTGRVIEARQEVENLIASLEQEARMEAVRDLLVQSYKDQYIAMADAEQALKDYDAASIALNDTAEKLANCPWYDFKTHSELTAAQKKQTEAVNAAQQTYAQAMDTFDSLSSTIDIYTEDLVGMKLEEAGIGDEMVSGLETVKTSLGDTADSMYGYGADIATGLRTGVDENTKENEYKTVWQKIGDWFKNLFGIHSPSTVFKGYGVDLTDGLLNGIENYPTMKSTIEEWSGKVKEWFTKGEDGKGIVENFKQFGSDIITGFKDKVGMTSSNSKSSITTWATNVKTWFTSSSYGGVNKTNFSTFANDTIEGFRTKIGTSYVNTRTNISTWASDIKNRFTSSSYGGVNSTSFSNFANETINGFKNKISSAYTNVRGSISTWASDIKNRFTSSSYGGVNSTSFSNFANETINGFKNKITNSYTNAQYSMQKFGNSVVDWFKKPGSTSLVDSFINIGANIIQGFLDGVSSLWDKAMKKIKEFGQSIISKGKEGTEEHSPSRAFRQIGAFVIEGFNLGIEDMIPQSYKTMNSWLNGINAYQPVMSFGVDTSALRYYNSGSFVKTVAADVSARHDFSVDTTHFKEEFRQAVLDALNQSQLAEDMRRQADKEEQTIVQVGNRTISDAVTTQQKANGFKFVTT